MKRTCSVKHPEKCPDNYRELQHGVPYAIYLKIIIV
jgi:hypothetical protein